MRIARSLFWTYFGYLCELLAGALVVAYVVRHVSLRDYGVFLLAQSLGASLYLLDFGLANVLVQLFVAYNERRGSEGVSRLASTLVVSLLAVGCAGAATLFGITHSVPLMVHIPSQQAGLALLLVPLSGVAAALGLPASVLEDMCQAFHRFDVVNQIKIAVLLLRVTLTILVLHAGHGVFALTVVQIVAACARLLALSAAAQWSLANFSWARFAFDVAMLRESLGMSRWAFGDDVARRIGYNLETLILAGFGSFAQVSLFGIGTRLPAHINAFAAQGLKVALPSFSLDYVRHDVERAGETFLMIVRVCAGAMVPILVFLAVAARPLIEVWAGRAYLAATGVMVWQLASCLSQVAEIPSDLVLYSHNEVRKAASFSLLETILKLMLTVAFVLRWGAVGVAAAVAISHWTINLCFYLPGACRSLGIRARDVMKSAFGSANLMWISTIGGVAVLSFLVRYRPSLQAFAGCLMVSIAYGLAWLKFSALPLRKITQAVAPETNVPHPYPQPDDEF